MVKKKNEAAHAQCKESNSSFGEEQGWLRGGRSDVECERKNDHCRNETVPIVLTGPKERRGGCKVVGSLRSKEGRIGKALAV